MNPKRLLLFFAILKSVIWMAFGFLFGSASIIIMFTANLVYDKQIDLHILLSDNYVMFLCIGLMAGSAADYFNSPGKPWSERIIPILLTALMVAILGFLYHPFVKETHSENVIRFITVCYCIFTFIFCGVYKSILFYEESCRSEEKDLPKIKIKF